jgi:hypothetical protein
MAHIIGNPDFDHYEPDDISRYIDGELYFLPSGIYIDGIQIYFRKVD